DCKTPSLASSEGPRFATRSGSLLCKKPTTRWALPLLAALASLATTTCGVGHKVTCDPVNPTACMPDQKCSFYLATQPKPTCNNIIDTLGIDASCMGTADDCDAGLQCVGNMGNRRPSCRKFCATDADCGAGRKCNLRYNDLDYLLCSDPQESCDVIQQDC